MGWIDLRPFLHVVDRSDPCDRESRSPQRIRIARPGAFPQSHAPSVPGHTTSEVRAPAASKVSACTSPSAELTVGRPAYLGAPREARSIMRHWLEIKIRRRVLNGREVPIARGPQADTQSGW